MRKYGSRRHGVWRVAKRQRKGGSAAAAAAAVTDIDLIDSAVPAPSSIYIWVANLFGASV